MLTTIISPKGGKATVVLPQNGQKGYVLSYKPSQSYLNMLKRVEKINQRMESRATQHFPPESERPIPYRKKVIREHVNQFVNSVVRANPHDMFPKKYQGFIRKKKTAINWSEATLGI